MKNNLIILGILLYSSIHVANAQEEGNVILNNYSNQAEISGTKSVTLKNGFHIPYGRNVRIFTGANFQNCINLISTPTSNHNYVLTRTFKIPYVKESNLNEQRKVCDENHSIQYFDGLGRPIQGVIVQGSPNFRDIVQPISYDVFGRETKKHLPYVSSLTNGNGNYKASAIADQTTFYNDPLLQGATGIIAIPGAFSETLFEPSPLSRTVEQGAPGTPWQVTSGHTQKLTYGSNNSNLAYSTLGFAVRLYVALPVLVEGRKHERTLSGLGFYTANQLYLTISKDENWSSSDGKAGTVEEYKNKEGKIVLKRIFNKNNEGIIESFSTYYVFDALGNLSFVLPPGANPDATSIPSQSTLNNFCFQYRFDGSKRVIEKKTPGKGWEHLVYNKLNQVVLSQDVLQKESGNWLFSKYDGLGRTIITGIMNSNLSRLAWQDKLNEQENLWEGRDDTNHKETGTGYTNIAIPDHNLVKSYYTISYYDDYSFYGNSFSGPTGTEKTLVKGLSTGVKVNVLGAGATLLSTMLLNNNYYDEEDRIIRSKGKNHLLGEDEIFNTWNFAGELTNRIRKHTVGNVITTITNRYRYDHMGRKLVTIEKIDTKTTQKETLGEEVVLSKLSYNELGQLQKKELHSDNNGGSYLQKMEYSYNERGWIKTMTSDQFSLRMKYSDGTIPQFNGNTANQDWGAGQNYFNTYSYSYDKLNRLEAGVSKGMSEVLSYDMMGNIKTMNRDTTGKGTYNYVGNRLTDITGGPLSTGSYSYDNNGNVTTDGRTGISLTYNILNLPSTATKTGLNLVYTYNTIGNRLRKLSNGITRDYVSEIEYNGNTIDIIQTEEGQARNNGGRYSYEYNLTDHLGNVRYSFYKHPEGQLQKLQSDDYYPFGMQKSTTAGQNKYLYNGKEIQNELGQQYDYGARFYDPVIGRWNMIDPSAEDYIGLSPYSYVLNNPIKRIDPDGRDAIFTIARDKNNNITSVNVSATVYIKGSGASEKRAGELTNYARSILKSKSVEGIGVSFSLNYQYSKDKTLNDLNRGENLLTFSADIESDNSENNNGNVSHVVPISNSLVGNKGTIYSSGKNNFTVLHESIHLLGLNDRYFSTNMSLSGPRQVTVQSGFENDIMGQHSKTNFSSLYYQYFLNKASSIISSSDKFYHHPIFNLMKNKPLQRFPNNERVDMNPDGSLKDYKHPKL